MNLPHITCARGQGSHSNQTLLGRGPKLPGILKWGRESVVSSPLSAGQDLEEGFAELHIEGSIDNRVQGTVHVA